MVIRKILAHDIRMKKNPHTKEDTLWIFKDFHDVMRVHSVTWPPHGSFISGVANPEMIYMLLRLQILYIN